MKQEGMVSGIGRAKGAAEPKSKRLARIPIAPPFFLLGTCAGLYASVFQGAQMWLLLNGYVIGTVDYAAMRSGHAALQILAFFGAFISGFLLQAMPRLLETSHLRPVAAMWLLPLFTVGVVAVAIAPGLSFGYGVLGLHFLCLTLLVARLAYLAPRHALYRSGVPLVWGVAWLFIGTIVDLGHPVLALLVLWGSIVPIAEVAVRRVFFTLAGIGNDRNTAASILATTAYFTSMGLLTWAAFAPATPDFVWTAFAIASTVSVGAYIIPRLPQLSAKEFMTRPLAFGFWAGLVWLLAGTLSTLKGAGSADAMIHLLSTGFALPLIFVVAPHVVRGHTGIQPFPVPMLISLVALWQLVPLGRGLKGLITLPAWFSIVVAIAASVTFVVWAAGVIRALSKTRLGLKPTRQGIG